MIFAWGRSDKCVHSSESYNRSLRALQSSQRASKPLDLLVLKLLKGLIEPFDDDTSVFRCYRDIQTRGIVTWLGALACISALFYCIELVQLSAQGFKSPFWMKPKLISTEISSLEPVQHPFKATLQENRAISSTPLGGEEWPMIFRMPVMS